MTQLSISEWSKRIAERIISGQETVYDPQLHIPLLIELFSSGKDIAHYCANAEISDSLFRKWRKRYKAFEEAYNFALELARAWWLTEGSFSYDSKLWQVIMKNRFGYTDSRRLKIKELKNAKSFDSQYQIIREQISEGVISINEALHLASMVAVGAKIHETTTLVQDVAKLKEIVNV